MTSRHCPAIYECHITHARTAPVRNVFSYRGYQWLVDLDDVPRFGPLLRLLASFRPAGHLTGGPGIRHNLEDFLATRGIDLGGGTVLMLTQARVLGYVFNPLTLYWCHNAAGRLECVVAEVHNTYRQRHAYLLRTGSHGQAQTPKTFYVSPFFPVDGHYRMHLPEPGDRLTVSIVLHRPGGQRFTASMHGHRLPGGRRSLAAAALRHPWPTLMVAARIRWQGIKLYLRGLPVQPQPARAPQEGSR